MKAIRARFSANDHSEKVCILPRWPFANPIKGFCISAGDLNGVCIF